MYDILRIRLFRGGGEKRDTFWRAVQLDSRPPTDRDMHIRKKRRQYLRRTYESHVAMVASKKKWPLHTEVWYMVRLRAIRTR